MDGKLINTKDSESKVLYVEDDEISILLFERLFKDKLIIDFARNAEEAIQKATEIQYSLIMMDINLGKGNDGIYVTNELRKFENYKNIPIIAVTAFAMLGDKEDFISKGCTDYISKPYDTGALFKLISKYTNVVWYY
ncbi:MAG: response regulator [Ignavibacteriae bacterium]|nr:response regulator [Ignavibacteriota bacterium]